MYILECAGSSYYVGSTWDLERRLEEHSTGAGALYTSRRLPVRLVFTAEFDRIDDAYAFEKRVQNWSRRKRQALIEGRFADLPGLSGRFRLSDR
jgi:putative endonuclease